MHLVNVSEGGGVYRQLHQECGTRARRRRCHNPRRRELNSSFFRFLYIRYFANINERANKRMIA